MPPNHQPPQRPATDGFQRYWRDLARGHGEAVPGRPWLLLILAFGCAVAVIAGAIGPWLVSEHGPMSARVTDVTSGYRTDGAFVLVAAAVAIAGLVLMIVHPDADFAPWLVCIGLGLCAVIGLLDWMFYTPRTTGPDVRPPGEVITIGWGVKIVGIAGAAGAAFGYMLVRDYDG